MSDFTAQDDLLAKINGLTGGMSLPEDNPQVQSPVMPQPSVMPQPAPMPQAAPMPQPMQSVQPDMPLPMASEQNINQALPQMNPAPMPEAPSAIPVAPEMPLPGSQDAFAQSIGAVPMEQAMPQMGEAPANDVPSMTSRIPVPDNKIPTFDKPTKKKSKGGFGFIVALLIILIISAIGFILYQRGMFDSLFNKQPVVEEIDTVDDSFVNVEPEIQTPQVEFVDETRTEGIADKVIEAKYKMEGLDYDESYIKLPYVNLTTDDAKTINSEIQELYKSLADTSSKYKLDNMAGLNDSTYKQKYLLTYYQAITQGDIVSILINELNYEGQGDAIWTHKAYTFSASTGKALGLKDLETILSVDDNAMNQAYETYITQLISQSTASESKKTFEHKINAFKTLQDYYSNINSNSGIEYYVDGMGRINIITKVYIGDKNIFKIVAYGPTGCAVKALTINDAKTFVGYKPMEKPTSDSTNVDNQGAVVTTASSNLQVSAKSLSKYVDGDLIKGEDLIKLFSTYENMLGQKGDSLTFQVSNDIGSKSYSKGDKETLEKDVISDGIYKLEIINYASGNYRIIKAKLYSK